MKHKNKSRGEIKRLMKFVRGNRQSFIIAVVFSILYSTLAVLYAYVMKNLIDSANEKNYKELINVCILFLAVMFFEFVIDMVLKYTSGRFEEGVMFNIRKCFVEHIINIPERYMENQKAGDIESRYINDLNNIKDFFTKTVFDIVKQPFLLILSAAYMFYLNWQLTLISLAIVPLFIYLSAKVTKPIYKYTKEQQEALSNENSILANNLMGITTIKIFLLESRMLKKYGKAVDTSVSKELKLAKINSMLQPLLFIISMTPFLIIFIFGSFLISKHVITIGRMIAIVQLQNTIVDPIMTISNILSSMNSTKASSSHIYEILDESEERCDGQSYRDIHCSDAVSLDNVVFSYDGTNNIVNGFTESIKSGETTAIVGKSGCGKSTILKLITGVYSRNSGIINFLGHDISKWNLHALRNNTAVVPQNVYIFPESIYKNILYGNENASKEDVINAAKAANIHDFIISQPDGYDTQLGENGTTLSGGEKQRIGIARAVLKGAAVVVMDEPTSALDAENEKLINNSIQNIMKNHTVIIVAHRLSTIKNASKIIVMNDGKVCDSGTHDELMKRCGIYSGLYTKQLESQEV